MSARTDRPIGYRTYDIVLKFEAHGVVGRGEAVRVIAMACRRHIRRRDNAQGRVTRKSLFRDAHVLHLRLRIADRHNLRLPHSDGQMRASSKSESAEPDPS